MLCVNSSIHVSNNRGCALFRLVSKVFDILFTQKTPAACIKTPHCITKKQEENRIGYAKLRRHHKNAKQFGTNTDVRDLLGKWKIADKKIESICMKHS